MAQLLGAHRQRKCPRSCRHVLRHGAHRGLLQTLRRSSWACLRRWTEANRPALLHELCIPQIRQDRLASGKAHNRSMPENAPKNAFDQILSEVNAHAEFASDLAILQNFIVEIIPQRCRTITGQASICSIPMIRRCFSLVHFAELLLSMCLSL